MSPARKWTATAVAAASRPRRLGALTLVAAALSCGAPTASKPETVAGVWAGPDSNRLGLATLTLELTQDGSAISGVAVLRPIDPGDGSCGSCHRFKDGTITGAFDGSQLTLTMIFPKHQAGDPTPECSVEVSGVVTRGADGSLAGSYTGTDPCEGTLDGTIALTRSPARLEAALRQLTLRAARPHR
jgi:hypothetical protein